VFADCQLMGMDFAFPDICKTPPALLPIPYPNFAIGPMAIPNVWNTLLMMMPAHNLLTTIPMTNGDNAGLALGLISQTVMSQARRVTCVPNVLFGCIPATRLTCLTIQNTINTMGIRALPSQLKVVLLGGGGGAGRGAKGGKGGTPGRGARTGRLATRSSKSGKGGPAPKSGSSPKSSASNASRPSPKSGQAKSAKPGRQKADPRYKRGKFRKGVRDKAWDAAKGKDGKVRDPVTKKVMKKDEPWDMGHKPGYEHRKHVKSAAERDIDRKQFLDEYNEPSHYRPELPRSNRGHQGELKTDDYFGF